MRPVLDEQGRLFGVVNIVDLAVVVVVFALLAASVGLVFFDERGDERRMATVDVRTEGVQPYVADAIPGGPVSGGTVDRVLNRSVTPTQVLVTTADGDLLERDHPRLKTVELTLELPVTEVGDTVQFNGRTVTIGRPVALDFGRVTLRGNVTAVNVSQ